MLMGGRSSGYSLPVGSAFLEEGDFDLSALLASAKTVGPGMLSDRNPGCPADTIDPGVFLALRHR